MRNSLLLLVGAGLCAGAQNALAGGGGFLTFPALLLAGLDPRAATITSTVGLFPGQIATAWSGRGGARGVAALSARHLVVTSLVGGVLGAILLLLTPPTAFARAVPWLVMFATAVFATSDLMRARLPTAMRMPAPAIIALQTCVAVYGGYFGGGIGFLMLALLALAGQSVQTAAATKNLLTTVMCAAAVAVVSLTDHVAWREAAAIAGGAVLGGILGGWLLRKLPQRPMRIAITAVGAILTVWLFARG
jgi:uncharacterized membrane protein YfcA